ncbi:MAG: DUF4838 domain-containing protein, partial [Clostridia bacterium]|nr:DUF4838 domain-containing protein [Clostridia bacterium]
KLVQLVNNGAGSWTVTINAKIAGANVEPYGYTATGTTLKAVLSTWFEFSDGADVYLTEIRGVAMPPAEMYGTKIVDKAIDGFAESTAKVIPEGFEKVYYLENVAAGVTFADVGIAGYEEVRFYLSLTGGYFAIKGWGAYAQNLEFLDAWKLVQLVNNGDGTWTVTINAKIAGANVEPYSYTATGTTLKEVLSTWFSFSEGADVYLTEIRGEKGNPWGELIKAQILKNSTVADESNLPSSYENYQCVYTLTNLSMNSFVNLSLNTYAELRFMIKHDNFLMLDGYNRCFGNNDGKWIPVTLVNNGAGKWTITTDVPVYDVNNGWASLGRSYEMTGYTLKDLLGAWRSESTTAVVYVTELRGIEREMPVPEIPESFVELEPQSNPVLWGERVTDSALANAEIKAETAPVGYELVSYKSALNKGDFASVDVSAYTELRFAIKSTNGNGWILFGDWTYFVHTPNEWVTVYLNKQVDSTWRMSVSANVANGKPSPTEYTAKYSGSSLQEILADWYNDASADFYVTELRGSKEEVYVTTDLAFMESPTLTEEAAPSGFSKVYSTAGGFTTDNVSSYKELYFAFKHSGYFLIEGWNGYVDAPNDWVYMSLFNNGDGTWKVVFEGIKADEGQGVVYLGSAMNGYEFGRHERYEKIYNGSTLSEIFASCTPTGSTVFTEIKALKEVEESEAGMKISNLVFTQVVATDGESVPTGYDNVYLKNGLAKGDFATVDISEYAEVNFMFKSNGYVQFDDAWAKYVDSRNWVSVHLENTGNGSEWDVYVNDEFTYTCAGTTLNEVLALWHSDYTTEPFQMYVTDLRGIAGGYTIDKVRSIVMSKSDALVADNVSAARALAAEIKALTGKELLIEYYDDVNMLEADGRYLVLGSFALEMGAIEDGLEMETGYKLQRIGNNVCMFGISEYGHLNAVYGFLKEYFGLVYYTDTVNSHVDAPEDAKIGMRETIIFNPNIEYNWIIDGIAKDKDMYADRLGMVELGIGGNGWHNFLTIVSEEEYGASGTVAQHAEWFVTRNSNRTLDITTEENRAGIAAVVAEKFAEQINSSSLKRVQFSAPDFVDASLNTSDYVKLMNKVAEALNPMISRKVELILLAYNSTMEVPQDATLESYENVMLSVMVAPVEYNYYYDFNNDVSYMNDSTKTNLWFYEQIEKWSNVLKDGSLYFWNYSVFFDNYFVPLDTITNMQSKYQALADAGVAVIYDLGMYNDDVGTDWTALKLYLKAELGKNVNAKVDALIESFMKAYYGEAAAPYMLQLLNAQQAHYATIANKIPAGNVVRSKLFNKSLWGGDTNDMLVTWYGYIQSALNVTTDKTLRERIHVEGLSIRYLNSAVYATVNAFGVVTDVADLTVTYAANETTGLDDMSKVIADAKALGIDRFAESKGWICNESYAEKNPVDGVIDNLA